jgi:hypothetical protein
MTISNWLAADSARHVLVAHHEFRPMGDVGQNVTSQASDLVVNAMGYLGVPYRRGGTGIQGFDCSGFVQAMYEKTLGLVLPHNAKAQAAVTEKIDKSELQPGDLVFFNTLRRAFSHVGIYIGDGKFIHSPRPGGEVRIEEHARKLLGQALSMAHVGSIPRWPARIPTRFALSSS